MILIPILNLMTKLTGNENLSVEWFYDENNSRDEVNVFINFLKNKELLLKIEELANWVNFSTTDFVFKDVAFLNNDEKNLLLAIFILKSLTKISTPPVEEIFYINSDNVINESCLLINKFFIWYKNCELPDEIKIKKKIFAEISSLVYYGIVKEKIVRADKKTLKEWSLGVLCLKIDNAEYLNISDVPYEIINVSGIKYLKGKFFTKIFKIFNENLKSGKSFQLKNESYLYKLASSEVYINNQDLNDVIDLIEKNEKISLNEIENIIVMLMGEVKSNNKQISLNKKKLDEIFDTKINTFVKETCLSKNIKTVEQFADFVLNKLCDEIFNKKKKTIQSKNDFLNKIVVSMKNKCANRIINDNSENMKLDWKLSEMLLSLEKKELHDIIKKNFKNNQSSHNLKILNETKFADVEECENKLETCAIIAKKFISNELWVDYYLRKDELCGKLITLNKEKYAKISKLMLYHHLWTLKKYNYPDNKAVYLPFFFDFRGRFYYLSIISPTTLKYSRFIFNYGYFVPHSYQPTSLTEKILKYNDFVSQVKIWSKLTRNEKWADEAIFWTLISIGKLKIDKSLIKIDIELILQKGLDLLFEKDELTSLSDLIEFNHYKKILLSLNDSIILKRGLLKDATASFMQNLIRLLGYKNLKSLEYANLNSMTTWYDTYSFILNEWVRFEKTKNSIDDKILALFTRSSIKKTVMTHPYSAKYQTAFTYFKDAVMEKYGISVEYFSPEEELFKKFYYFISNEVENNYFLKNNSSKIVEHIKKVLKDTDKQVIIETDDAKSDLVYFKFTSKTYDLIINFPRNNFKKRISKKYDKLIDEVDYDKIATSIRANWVHFIDGMLVRDINKNFDKCFISIHDCFIVDPFAVSKFILVANKESNKKIFANLNWNQHNNDEFFSLFIFI